MTTDRDDTVEALLSIARILLILMPIVGCFGGLTLGQVYGTGAFARWKPLPTPPARAIDIYAGDPWVVYIKAEDDRVYSCHHGFAAGCWEEDTISWGVEVQDVPCNPPLDFSVARPPGDVLDRTDTYNCHFEVATQGSFVLLEDGSLWRWAFSDSPLGDTALLVVSAIGGVVSGALIGFLIIVGMVGCAFVWHRFREWRQ